MKRIKTLLEVKNISIGYSSKKKKTIIADSVTVTLETGKLIALVGANGIGKSTLLRTITGIQKPITGDVLLLNKSIYSYTNKTLAQNLSIVLTEKLPPSNLSVYELVALGRQPYTNWLGFMTNRDREKTNEAMRLTGITSLADKRHYEISDGQLQKVLIARALAQDTPLIILDEPTTHLDLLHKVALLKLLKTLTQETGKCILFSTHDIDMAIELCDEMIIMTSDQLIQDTPCKLIEKGTFNTIFRDEQISFDTEKGKFVIR